jgi:hypothetical protein
MLKLFETLRASAIMPTPIQRGPLGPQLFM